MFQCQKCMRSIWSVVVVLRMMVLFCFAVVVATAAAGAAAGHRMHFSAWDFIAFSRNFACFGSIPSSSCVFDLAHTIFLLCHHFDPFLHFICSMSVLYVYTLSHIHLTENFSRFSISSKAMVSSWCRNRLSLCRWKQKSIGTTLLKFSRFFFICSRAQQLNNMDNYFRIFIQHTKIIDVSI